MRRSDLVERLISATMYEGYLLYPYRPSVKNQFRWTFGVAHLPAFAAAQGASERSELGCDLLLQPGRGCRLELELHFLRLVERAQPGQEPWEEAEPVVVSSGPVELGGAPGAISIPVSALGGAVGSRRWWPVAGVLSIRWSSLTSGALKLEVGVANRGTQPGPLSRGQALRQAMIACHLVAQVERGGFVSMSDPPGRLAEAARACGSRGLWPALVGPSGSDDTVLCSPIVLQDHPEVAQESPQDLFDSTEIDELLTLRVLALTDDEKELMRRTDPRARALMDRSELLGPDDFMRLHGRLRRDV